MNDTVIFDGSSNLYDEINVTKENGNTILSFKIKEQEITRITFDSLPNILGNPTWETERKVKIQFSD